MITNERQHRITRAEINRFAEAIARAEHDGPAPDVHHRVHRAMIDGLCSQLADLRKGVGEYEALRDGKITRRVFTSLLDLPSALIEGRIVRRLTQRELGVKLGVPEQQIQRYESTRYAGVGIERLQEVADALGIKLTETVEYNARGARSGAGAKKQSAAITSGKAKASKARGSAVKGR